MEWFMIALISAILSSLSAVTQKRTLFKEHALEFVAVLAIFNMIITIPILFIFKPNLYFNLNTWFFISIDVLTGTVAFIYVSKAIRHMELSHSSPLLAFGPALTTLVAFLFLKESINLTKLAGIGLIVLGAYTLEIDHKNMDLLGPIKTMIKSKYIHYIFLALILYAFSSTLDRYLLNPINNFNVVAAALMPLEQIFQCIFYVLLIIFFYDGVKGIAHGIKESGKWIFLVSLFTSAYRFADAFAISMPAAKVGLVLAIKRTSVLFSTILGGQIFHESGLKQKIMACVIMILGVYLIVI